MPRAGLPQAQAAVGARGGGSGLLCSWVRVVAAAGCCAPGPPLSLPWRVKEVEALLGALSLPSLSDLPGPLALRGLSDARLSRPG
jgi:hypothetical protein